MQRSTDRPLRTINHETTELLPPRHQAWVEAAFALADRRHLGVDGDDARDAPDELGGELAVETRASTSPARVTTPSSSVTSTVSSIQSVRRMTPRRISSAITRRRARTRTRSVRVTMPTRRPAVSTTGSRLILGVSQARRRATEAVGSTVVTGNVIASATVRAASLRSSEYVTSGWAR